MVSSYALCYYDLSSIQCADLRNLETGAQLAKTSIYFSIKWFGVSADPAEQLGAKNSISPKNDLRSFCTNVTICKI